jgi:TATA-binding protein-associated factor Taf7
MDVDDDDDFYAPTEDTPDGTHQHEQQAATHAEAKSEHPEDLEEGEEEDEGEDDGSDSVRHVLISDRISLTYLTPRTSTSSPREKMAQRPLLRRVYFINLRMKEHELNWLQTSSLQ